MAAADYFHAGPPPAPQQPNSPYLAPPPQPQRTSSHPGFVYPPYQPSPQPSPQQYPPSYQPTPVTKPPNPPYGHTPPQRNSFSHQQRPDPQTWNQSYPPPPNPNQQFQYSTPQFSPPPHQGHRPSSSQPYLHPEDAGTFDTGYSSDPERRRRHHHHHQHQPNSRKKSGSSPRSTATDGFLGAAGGGLIGDLLFPGLGTVGGALAGWLGGKEYGEHRKRRDSKLEVAQREWEEKFDPDGSRRRSSGDRDRKRSHDSGRH